MSLETLLLFLFTGALFGTRFIPPRFRFLLSPRKRRAMCLALDQFIKTHDVTPYQPGCCIYKTDANRCIVMIQHTNRLHPPPLTFYSVPHDSDLAIHIGSGHCHWGIQPENIWHKSGK